MKKKRLALLLAVALTVTSVEGTVSMVSGADFASEVDTEAEVLTAEAEENVVEVDQNVESTDIIDSETADVSIADTDEEEPEVSIQEADEIDSEFTDGEDDIELQLEEDSAEAVGEDTEQPKLIKIEADGVSHNTMLEGAVGIDYYVAAKITLTFENDETTDFTFPLGEKAYIDTELTKGYKIEASLKRGSEGDDLMGQKLSVSDTYYLYFTCGDVSTYVPVYVRDIESTGIYMTGVNVGENTVYSYKDSYRYYKFVPQETDIYEASTNSTNCAVWQQQTNEDGSKSYTKLEGHKWQLTKDEPVYFQVWGGLRGNSSESWTNLTVKQQVHFEDIEVNEKEITLLENYGAQWGNAFSDLLKFNYTNAESKTYPVALGDEEIQDNEGNIAKAELLYADGEKIGQPYVWAEDQNDPQKLPIGSYKLVFTVTKEAQTQVTAETLIKVVSLADYYAQLTELNEGTQDITVSEVAASYYRFEPKVTGTYKFSNMDYLLQYTVAEFKDNQFVNVDSDDSGTEINCTLEKDKKYIITINRRTGNGNVALTVERLPMAESVEILSCSPGNLVFIEGTYVTFEYMKVRLKTEKGVTTKRINGSGFHGETTDEYGNILGYALFKIKDDGFEALDFDNIHTLPAGDYAFRVYYGSKAKIADEYIPVRIKSVEEEKKKYELRTDSKLTVPVENSIALYSFTPEKTGRYEISTNAHVQCSMVDNDWNSIGKQSNNETSMYVNLTAGTTYTVYITSYTLLCTEVQVTARQLPIPTKLTASVKKSSYIAEIDNAWDIDPEITVEYDNGDVEFAKVDDWISGWQLGCQFTNDKEETLNYYDVIPAGMWKCIPYLSGYYGKEEIPGMTVVGADIRAVSPDIDVSALDEMQVDTPVTVPVTNRKFYKLAAAAGETYILNAPTDITAEAYEWNETDGLKLIKYANISIETDKIYLIGVTADHKAEISVTKYSGVPGSQKFEETYEMSDGFKKMIRTPEGKEGRATLNFTFTPEKSGTYSFQVKNDAKLYIDLYANGSQYPAYVDSSTSDLQFSFYLEEGKTYRYEVSRDMYEQDEITVSFNKTDYKQIKNVALSLKEGMKASDLSIKSEITDVYDIKVQYTDDSVAVCDSYMMMDKYGNVLSVYQKMASEEVELAEGTCKVMLGYRNAEEGIWKEQDPITVPIKGVGGLQSLKTGDSVYPFNNQSISSWYTFTPSESGQFLWKVKTEKGEASPDFRIASYNVIEMGWGLPVSFDEVEKTAVEGGYTAWLQKGETYLIGLTAAGAEYNRNLTLSVDKAKVIKSVEVKQSPNQDSVYKLSSFTDVSLEGMVITVYYTDGTSEEVAYGQTDSNGNRFEADYGYWTGSGIYRQYLHMGNCAVYVDFKEAQVPKDIPTLKANTKTSITVSDKTVAPVRFVPEETGFYSVETSNAALSTVVNEETKERWVDTTYYLEAGKSYLIYVFVDQKDAYVTVWKDACQWKTVKRVNATCTENAKYVMQCDVHNHTNSYYDYSEKAYGHAYSDWKMTRQATCTADGEEVRICANCNNAEKRTIKSTGHSYSAWKTTNQPTCTVNGTEERTCVNCNNIEKREIKATGQHKFGDWVQTREPDVLTEGQQERSCSVCGEKETRTTAKLKATIALNVSGTIPLKTKQTFNAKVTTGKGDKVVSWKSSNKKVVSVSSSGKIKGLKAGKTATITVQLQSGLKKSFKVKVQKKAVATKSLKVVDVSTGKKISSKVSLKSKQTLKLMTTVSPVTSKEKVKYSSSNKKVVSVSSKGVIKAKKKGKATITVKSGKKIYKIKITVK